MALMGRPPLGPRLVDALEISEDSQKKLRLILETIAGQKTLAEAAQELCISETRFHVIRQEALLGAAAALEPGTPGRPPTQKLITTDELDRLRRDVVDLKAAMAASEIREEIAVLMPHLLRRGKKTSRRRTRL
jgi:23S rRNA maturation-related 3'-5' exoribonuclease YhaM